MIQKILVFISGIIFGLGLTISNMTNPAKVISFLDLFGSWDPSLAFVMGGAILVTAPLLYILRNKENVVLVDTNDNKLGLMEKLEAHRKGLLHRAFSVFILDEKKRSCLELFFCNIFVNLFLAVKYCKNAKCN